jgi:MOSC domain-containing protein YiiM
MYQGNLISIHIASVAGGETVSVEKIRAVPGRGLEGDRFFAPAEKPHPAGRGRQVTLIEIEAIEALKSEKGIELAPKDARRNLVTRGVALNHLVGKDFRIGEVTLRGVRLCEPCDHLAAMTQPEVTPGLIHRGGLRCDVLTEGTLHTDDEIVEI